MADFVPTPEEQRMIEAADAAWEAKKHLALEPHPRQQRFDFPLGLDDNFEPFPLTERKPAEPVDAPAPTTVEDHEWDGATLRQTYRAEELRIRDQVADAARDGHWEQLFEILGHRVNRIRPGGKEAFTPLHQAAWHGAPADVARKLIDLGAWRTVRNARGLTPQDIAVERGHAHLAEVLTPVIRHPLEDALVKDLENQLHLLIRGRSAELVLAWQLRLPRLGPLTELTEPKLIFPVPGQEGGFSIELRGDVLRVASWNRAVRGWAQIHAVTRNSIQLTDDGWDLRIPDETPPR